MCGVRNDFEVLNNYNRWNRLLWSCFFPENSGNPILYIDEDVLRNAINNGNEEIEIIDSLEQTFLSSTLLDNNQLRSFIYNWNGWQGRRDDIARINRWDKLVKFLLNKRSRDDVPLYFAMLCAIMYLACKREANHDAINTQAREYLGDNYRGHVGQLVDDLFTQLHEDIRTFDPNRAICMHRHIGKIQYHKVLSNRKREQLISFLEINDLKWEYEPYSNYVNETLIPTINRSFIGAERSELIKFVTNPDYLGYLKDLLRSRLDFGRQHTHNEVERVVREIRWKYEIEFNYSGNVIFYITTGSSSLPFSIAVSEGEFRISNERCDSDVVVEQTNFIRYPDTTYFEEEGIKYAFLNIAVHDNKQNNILWFEQKSDRSFVQVEEPQEGLNYLLLASEQLREPNDFEEIDLLQIEGYNIFWVNRYNEHRVNRENRRREKLEDPFELNGVGSWFSINLSSEERLFWKADCLNAELTEIEDLYGSPNDKVYFRLPRTSENQLSGYLYVTTNNGKNYKLSEHIIEDFSWDGTTRSYYMNGWGEVTTDKPQNRVLDFRPHQKKISNEIKDRNTNWDDKLMLIQILYDVADKNGCVSQAKIVAALNFVLQYYGLDPTRRKRNNLIYALRRLGYMIAHYNSEKHAYTNQLIPYYLSPTNYSFDGAGGLINAHVIKGVYSCKEWDCLINKIDQKKIKRCTPYNPIDLGTYPEYQCLPDMLLLSSSGYELRGNWHLLVCPPSHDVIDIMANMNGFSDHFQLEIRGDHYLTPNEYGTPCIISEGDRKVLCTKRNSEYFKHRTYIRENNETHPIPIQLAKLYCLNEHDLPVCIMRRTPNSTIDLSKITFSKEMSIPELFDIALCDLNLGLPTYERLFIVEDGDNESSITYGWKYSTHATTLDYTQLQIALEKLSARRIDDFTTSSAIYLSINNRHIGLTMTLVKDDETFNDSYVLKSRGEIISFSLNRIKKVYYKTNDGFNEVAGKSLEDKLSSIILNNQILTDGTPNSEDIERVQQNQNKDENIVEITIIKK